MRWRALAPGPPARLARESGARGRPRQVSAADGAPSGCHARGRPGWAHEVMYLSLLGARTSVCVLDRARGCACACVFVCLCVCARVRVTVSREAELDECAARRKAEGKTALAPLRSKSCWKMFLWIPFSAVEAGHWPLRRLSLPRVFLAEVSCGCPGSAWKRSSAGFCISEVALSSRTVLCGV